MPRTVPTTVPTRAPAGAISTTSNDVHSGAVLQLLGGRQFVDHTVAEFYQAVGKYLAPDDISEHGKQQSRQAQFLSHALSELPEPTHTARARFLARGLNPPLFEAMLEFLDGRLQELGFSPQFRARLVESTSALYDRCEEPLSIAC
ncbi:hypothetical protein PVT68_03600 [Microbulbifer bruguierae]|uniref:Globin n=1 Tax=Microbulbifer bruguierae TaxID=3029061 RepID=A0ABY8NII4_9GAMM|nr:hypothetical protein [Microbulbifer bruguierae]WGL17388.1 hypothetical protein PVT68_03600 [Microbulbifer bruguierae]